jgi:hypothetical protein
VISVEISYIREHEGKLWKQWIKEMLASQPFCPYLICLTAVLSFMSRPSLSATGTQLYPFLTVR